LSSVDFRPLFEDNPNPIIVFDGPTRRLLAVNDAACRHFGYARDELVGRDIAMLRPPEDAERMRAAYANSRERATPGGPVPFTGRWRHQRKDGTIVHVEIWFLRFHFEGHDAVLALIHDVTAHVDAEEATRASEERYRLLFDAIPLPVTLFDLDTLGYLAVNDAAVQAYGWSRAEFLAMSLVDIRAPEDVPALHDTLERIGRRNMNVGVWRHRKKDGSAFDVELVTHVIEFAGRPARVVVATDVTERRRAEEQTRQAQRMEATGLLAGGVAHDFNNLLGVVLGATALAKRAAAEGRPIEAYLGEVTSAATRAADLTRKLLAFSRKQVLRVRTLDLGEALDDFVPLLRRAIGEDVDLVVRRADEPLVVSADASQLEQVLLNLCTNARQALPSGGSITIETMRTRFEAGDVAQAPWATPGHWAEVRVTDDGAGMDSETRERVFEPFFTTKTEGTGLGLAMVHGIVHQHRGLVHVDSRRGEGTTVRVCLPILAGASVQPPAPVEAPRTTARGGGETVLVAEDEPALRGLLAQTLSDLGYDVVTAADGEKAEAAFAARGGKIALAILDVVMPRLGGVQAYERMAAVDPALKVVFMTGYAPGNGNGEGHTHTAVGDIVARGGHALLMKPFDLDELGRAVRETLDARP
jgi:PAS domain S-box-containing protein